MSKKVKLKGEFWWAKVYEGDHDEYDDKQYYKITVVLDDESEAKFAKQGTKLKRRHVEGDNDDPDNDSPVGIQFKRDLEPKIVKDKKTGKTKKLGGGVPRVIDKNGDEMTSDQLIGNGSVGEVIVEFYKTSYKGRPVSGHRLEQIKVLELIPYEKFSEDEDEDEEEQEEEKVEVKKKSNSSRSRLNDDIPF